MTSTFFSLRVAIYWPTVQYNFLNPNFSVNVGIIPTLGVNLEINWVQRWEIVAKRLVLKRIIEEYWVQSLLGGPHFYHWIPMMLVQSFYWLISELCVSTRAPYASLYVVTPAVRKARESYNKFERKGRHWKCWFEVSWREIFGYLYKDIKACTCACVFVYVCARACAWVCWWSCILESFGE